MAAFEQRDRGRLALIEGQIHLDAVAVEPRVNALVEDALDVVGVGAVAAVGDLDLRRVDALLLEDLELSGGGVAGRAGVGHDRGAGLDAGARGRAMDLLDVLRHPRLVGGALDERRLDLGPLDPTLDVGDEEFGDLVRIAAGEEGGEVVVGVDPGAGDHLEPGLLGDLAHERDVAAEEHRGRVGDRLHAALDRRLRLADRDLELAFRTGHRVRWFLLRARGRRPLDVDGLVLGAKVLVDQRRAEVVCLDRTGDTLHRRHAASLSPA